MEKIEQDILDKAIEMFGKYGLKPVTMDDLASELSVSKKTLYRYVTNKEDLVGRAVRIVFQEVKTKMLAAHEAHENAIDELFHVDDMVCDSVENYNHSLQFQLRKYYPEIFSNLNQQRKELMLGKMKTNINKGIEQGLYRQDLNVEIISLLYYSRMVVLTGEEIDPFKDFDLKEVMREILTYHIRGMASPKGLDYLDMKMKQKKTHA
jgi:AcrR family transcriptional regulator